MLFCTPAPGLSHAGILACCNLAPLGVVEIYDILTGQVAVPTVPEPTYLQLTEVEQARGWLQQAEQVVMEIKERGGKSADLAVARRRVDQRHLEVRHAQVVQALGPLDNGRSLEFDYEDYGRYGVHDENEDALFHVPRTMEPREILRAIAIYDAAFAKGFAKGMARGLEVVRSPDLGAPELVE